MADKRESFPSLEDFTTGEGSALHKIVTGDAPSTKSGSLAFAFRDSAGNVILPQLNSEGKLPVTSEGAGLPKSAQSGGPITGATSNTLICEVSLTASKTYGKISARGACFREAIFQLIQLDDATETILDEFIVGPGHYSYEIQMGSLEIVAGATGTQKLQLKAKNLDKTSDFRGSLSALEYVSA
jgi:hypothetical protein